MSNNVTYRWTNTLTESTLELPKELAEELSVINYIQSSCPNLFSRIFKRINNK